jgi:hypothetical protein
MATDDSINISKGSKILEDMKSDIRLGVKYRRVFGKDAAWARYKNYYRGFWNPDTVPVNITYALGRSLIPQIYFRDPRIHVQSRIPGQAMNAYVVERIDNHLIGETGLKNQLKSSILDCYLCGRGPMIIGYDTEFGFNPQYSSAEWAADSSLTSFNKKGELLEYIDEVKPGMPWALRCNPLDFIVPWGTARWEDARWFAFRKMRMLKDVKEDKKYKNTATLKAPYKSRLEFNTDSRPEGVTRMGDEDSAHEWVELWQLHDKKTGRVFVLSLDHDKFLRDEIDYLQVEGLPAEVMGFNEDPDFFWWTPDVRLVESQQLELNDIRTMAKKHRRVALLKVLYDKGMVGKDELNKLLDADPKAAVGIDAGSTGDIRKAVTTFQSHVPPDLAAAAREVREDVREIIGFSRNQMGSFEESSGRRTATEAGIVKAASMIRVDERRDITADMLEKVIRKHNQLIFEHWTEKRVVDIVGPDGARYWLRFSGREIRGEFAYKINPEESVPSDQRVRREDYAKFMELGMKIPGMDMKYLMEHWARQFEEIDPKLLFPGEGPGRSPEKAMEFGNFKNQQMAGGNQGAMAQALGGM